LHFFIILLSQFLDKILAEGQIKFFNHDKGVVNMKKIKKTVLTASLLVGVLAFSGLAYADVITPVQKLSDLTGKSTEALYAEKGEGTFGALAADLGYLEEFRADMLENKKAVIAKRVEEGRLTQEQADEIIEAMLDHQALCDGTGYQGETPRYGIGFGQGIGQGQGMGMGSQKGFGKGNAFNSNR